MTAEEPLVSTAWLAERLGDPKVRVIDASFKLPGMTPRPDVEFREAHIPGAVYFDVETICDQDNALPHMFPSAQQFARDVSALGISSDDLVVAYDSGSWLAAPRAWWMFLAFGHRNVRVLDGGLQKWRAEGRAIESGVPTPKPGRFTAVLDPSLLRSKAQIVDNLAAQREQLIDARARNRFEGSAPEPRPGLRAGHIPGSRSLPSSEMYNAATGLMKSPDELRALFAREGLDLERPVVTTCGSGISAVVLTLGLYRLGIRNTALYDGSWSEWGLPDGPPVATGPA